MMSQQSASPGGAGPRSAEVRGFAGVVEGQSDYFSAGKQSRRSLDRFHAVDSNSLVKSLRLLLVWGLVLGFASSSQAQWRAELQLDQIRISSEVDADRIKDELNRLPLLRQSLSETLQIEIRSYPIRVMIFSSQANYRRYVSQRYPDGANVPALFIKGPDVLWVYVVHRSGWETDLKHEMTHAYLHSSLPYLPMWLDEGLAKYFELPAQAQGLQKDYLSGIKWRSRVRQPLRSKELEGVRSLTSMRSEHYRDSWGWVYYCLHSSTSTRQFLQNYLQRIQNEEVVGSFFDAIQRHDPNAVKSASNYLRSQ